MYNNYYCVKWHFISTVVVVVFISTLLKLKSRPFRGVYKWGHYIQGDGGIALSLEH